MDNIKKFKENEKGTKTIRNKTKKMWSSLVLMDMDEGEGSSFRAALYAQGQ